MFGLTQEEFTSLMIEAIVHGILWGLTFYQIRKGLNRRNFNVPNPEEKRTDFYWDALYGSFAAFCMVIIKKFIMRGITDIRK